MLRDRNNIENLMKTQRPNSKFASFAGASLQTCVLLLMFSEQHRSEYYASERAVHRIEDNYDDNNPPMEHIVQLQNRQDCRFYIS